MQTSSKAKAKSTRQDKAQAKTVLECYHDGNNIEDRVLRKEMIISMLICIITSPWYLAMGDDKRSGIAHYIVQIDDTMDALDVVYG